MKAAAVALVVALTACSPRPVPSEQILQPQSVAGAGQPQTGLEQVPLTIASANGVHRFTVAIAATPEQQETGLMFVPSLRPDQGMIFPYDPPTPVAFWMKNTLIPLDMIFIRADGTIGNIATAKPLDETPVPSDGAIAAVLEIAGGRAAELGIAPGDKVEWSR